MKKFRLEIITFVLVIFLVILLGVLLVFIRRVDAPNSRVGQTKGVMTEVVPVSVSTDSSTIGEKKEPIVVEPKEIVMAFGGDVMLSRVVGQKMVSHKDYTWPFDMVASQFAESDFAVINLESPFTISSGSHLVKTGSFSFNADPKAMAGLEEAGIDLVSLANNHFGNQGQKGMLDTFKVLASSSVGYAGAGKNIQEAHRAYIKEINGVKFGFLAYAYSEDLYIATADEAGMANMNLAMAKSDVAQLEKKVDVVVVLVHAGTEYTAKPHQTQITFSRGVIDAGADLVIGHHPHWVQSTEKYQGKYIIYSLGNLVFDQMWSTETREGAIAKAYFRDKVLQKIDILPIVINDYGQPALAQGAQKDRILARMGLKKGELE